MIFTSTVGPAARPEVSASEVDSGTARMPSGLNGVMSGLQSGCFDRVKLAATKPILCQMYLRKIQSTFNDKAMKGGFNSAAFTWSFG